MNSFQPNGLSPMNGNIISKNFSAEARCRAEKRFPDGTLDWFQDSDFTINCSKINLIDQLAKGPNMDPCHRFLQNHHHRA
jgi:hypothetical protein